MAMNLNSVLRITAEVTGLSSLTKLEGAVEGLEKAARSAGQGFKAMLESRAFQAAAAAAAGLGAAIGLSAKAAIDFESSMADVRKVVSGIETPQAFAEISNEIIGLSNRLPIAAKGFAEIYAAAGQAGIAREDLKQFAEQVAQTAIAFDMTAEEAGTAMAKIKTSLGLSLPELQNLTDAMNHLSNNTASTAKDIVEFTLRAGQAGQLVGLSAEQTAAFGSAMIAAGANTEVAATSFNNMVKALSRGPSMTERQIGALEKLGYVQEGAGEAEQRLTTEVEEQSRRRIEAARNETNEISKEINRRYRDQLQAIRDSFDDESSAYAESLQDRADEQIKGLQRQQEREVEAARQRAETAGVSADAEIQAIQDAYASRIDVIRDQLQQDLKERQRFDRDRLQQVQDGLDDQKDIEINAVQSRFEEVQRLEDQNKKRAIEAAKVAAQEASTAAAEQLAKGLQEDAIGTITDVFTRIRELPKEAQLSVVSDLFGDEAKAILPLINNTELLEKSLRLVGDQSQYAGSTLQEFLSRAATTANEAQLAQNNLQNLSIVFGQSFVPAITAVLQVLSPLIEGFTWMVQNIPGLGPLLAVLTAGFVALVAALPVAASIVTLLGQLGGFSTIFATIAGTLGAVVPLVAGFAATITGWLGALGPVIGVLTTLGQTLVAVFTGPVGWAVLLVAAGAAIYAFRDQIGAAFQAIGELISNAWNGLLDLLKKPFQSAIEWVQQNFITPIKDGISGIITSIQQTWANLGTALASPFQAAATTIRGVLNSVIGGVESTINGVIQAINSLIAGANRAASAVGLPQIPTLQTVSLPRFAEGGVVSGPTLAMVGEGGEPEYIVPQSKASAFAANWMAGVRGPAAIPRFAEGGVVVPSASVSIQTGPVTQMNGTNYVTTSDLSQAVQAGVNQTLALLRGDGTVRRAIGLV